LIALPVIAYALLGHDVALAVGTATEPRVALVVGNADYRSSPLRNPVNDARAVARALQGLGFVVILKENVGRIAMADSIRDFGNRIKGGGVGLFYYAGHGIQVSGRNFLIPVDVAIKAEDEVPYNSIDANFVLDKMDGAKNRLNIVILDACRNNPFARRFRSASRGLAQMDAPSGTLIAFATAPGMEAADGDGANGLYTEHLLRHLATPGLPIEQLFKQVRIGVTRATSDQQVPWESSSLKGDFYFNPSGTPVSAAVALATPAQPGGRGPVKSDGVFRDCPFCPDMVTVPAGKFIMGSDKAEPGTSEWPARPVALTRAFALGKYEVTFAQWQQCRTAGACRREGQSGVRAPELPAVGISWQDAMSYVTWLRKKTGKPYRLPSEAEWEYAARARSATARYWGDRPESACDFENVLDSTAVGDGADGQRAFHRCKDGHKGLAPVGRFAPNGFGVYDALGNVAEWVEDCWNSNLAGMHDDGAARRDGDCSKHVTRGGSWMSAPAEARSGARRAIEVERYADSVGFRVARDLP
jgi:formylglycine-generating enzyme required for sulfatase activity